MSSERFARIFRFSEIDDQIIRLDNNITELTTKIQERDLLLVLHFYIFTVGVF